MTPQPPPPPPPPGGPAPPRRGGGGLPGWAWALIAVGAVAAFAIPIAAVLALLGSRDAGELASEPPTPVASPPETAPPSPAGEPTSTPGDGGGGLDALFEDLMGDMDPMRLAQCIGTPSGNPDPLPEDPEAAIATIAEQVQDIRELELAEPVDPVLLAPDALRERVVELSADDYPVEVADVDGRLLSALGAIEPGTDLRELQLELLGEQVAGFYDPDTGELTAVAQQGLDATTRMTLAHEIDHALTDQALGLPDLEGFDGRSDEALATLAVIEGDASLLMQQWAVQQLTLMEQLGAAGSSLGPAEQLQATPWVLQQQLVYPYTTGLTFACDQYAAGGWDAVDALYVEPPTTTAQVLWPERYAAGEAAVDVVDPTLPEDWEEARRDQLGAADLMWLFQAPGDERGAALDDPEARARAWAGGELVIGTREDATAVAISLAEHPDATVPLCDSVTAWYGAAFSDATTSESGAGTTFEGTDQSAAITCTADRVHLGIAPDLDTATATLPPG